MGVNLKQEPDGSLTFYSDVEGQRRGRVGGPGSASQSQPIYSAPIVAKMPLTASNSSIGGSVLSWVNPENVAILIKRVMVHITAGSTAAATIDLGIGSTATTKNDTLIDGLSMASTGLFDNVNDAGSNGKARQALAVGYYVNAAKASGTVTSALTGNVHIEYVLA